MQQKGDQMSDYEVKCYSGVTRRQSELAAAFDLVANNVNWKMPVQGWIDPTDDKTLITDAVIHFTGSIPEFHSLPSGRVRVVAAGYYETIGA
jgi:hypothetical protein